MCKLSLNIVPNVYNSLQSSFLSLAWPWPGRWLPKGNHCLDWGPMWLGSQSTCQPPMPPDTPTGPLPFPMHPWCPLMPLPVGVLGPWTGTNTWPRLPAGHLPAPMLPDYPNAPPVGPLMAPDTPTSPTHGSTGSLYQGPMWLGFQSTCNTSLITPDTPCCSLIAPIAVPWCILHPLSAPMIPDP